MPRAITLALLLPALLCAQDPTDAQHARLDIEIFPTTQTITGSVTWDVLSNVNGLSSFTLDLHANFLVSNVTVDGVSAVWTPTATGLIVSFNQLYNQGQAFTVALDYSGTPASQGFGSFSWQQQPLTSTPVIASFSVPTYASTWWPCKDSLTDKFTTELWITLPDPLEAACNGALVAVDPLPGNRSRYRWASNYPIATYGVSVTASDYQVRIDSYQHAGGNMDVTFYAYPQTFAAAQVDMDRLVPMLNVLSGLFDQYPFVGEKYGICQWNNPWGMEHQTVSSQPHFGEVLSVHELAHSWFGNCVTCATWNDVGLNEGFATYAEALWDEHKPGGGVAAYHARMAINKPSNPVGSGSVYVTNTSNIYVLFDTDTVYRKGSWVLHQLRHVVGDAAFFQILTDYLAAKAYKSATWQDFATIATTSFGQDLTWLVTQCVMQPGAPSYALGWSPRQVAGQDYVFGHVRQTQTGSPYRFPIDVRVTTSTGQTTTRVWNDQPRDDFVLPTNGTATNVELDPDAWILRGPTALSGYTASLASSTPNVPWSGGTLTLSLDAGPLNANRPYLLGASATGIAPGVTFPDGKVLPLVPDTFSVLVFQAMGSPYFQRFTGMLDANGQATAQVLVPNLGAGGSPIELYFSFATLTAPMFISNPVALSIP